MSENAKTVDLTATIVSNYAGHNNVPAAELPTLIQTLKSIATGAVEAPKQELVPAVSIRASVKPDYIVCLEDGR